jgi:predicted nucleic acid-binding protein
MNRVFADSFFFFALLNDRDEAHVQALEFAGAFHGEIVTTHWIIAELADGMADAPLRRAAFLRFWDVFRADPAFVLLPLTQDLFEDGLLMYRRRPDKEWSLTDCISFAAMRQHRLDEALTGDKHFEQAGFACLLA